MKQNNSKHECGETTPLQGLKGHSDSDTDTRQTSLEFSALKNRNGVAAEDATATFAAPTSRSHEEASEARDSGKKKVLYPTKVTNPDNSDFNNKKLLFFQTFLYNTPAEREKLSNAVEFWDGIPRYSVTRRQQNTLRDGNTGTLPIYKMEFNYRRQPFVAEIRPAKITETGPDGKLRTIEYYPSNREEIIEEALRKIASRQSYGFIRQFPEEASGVAFSLYELRAELSKIGHTLSFQEIIQSLYILNYSSITIYKEGDERNAGIASPYMPVLVHATRSQLDADPSTKWIVHFHPFITKGIIDLQYRQFNYELTMSLSTQLCRWLHKYLCMKFTGAGFTSQVFEIHYKTIKRDSGLFKGKKERNFYDDLTNAFDELKEKGVLSSWTKKANLGSRGKVLDITYFLTASFEFIKEVKAANKRQAEVVAAALCKNPSHSGK